MRLPILIAACLLAHVGVAASQTATPPQPAPPGQASATNVDSALLGKQYSVPLARLALHHGSNAYRLAETTKERNDFQKAIAFLEISNELDPSDDAKFLWGASAFAIAQSATIDANKQKSCDLAQLARDSFVVAQTNLNAGVRKYPKEARELLTAIPQFYPAVSDQLRRFCKR